MKKIISLFSALIFIMVCSVSCYAYDSTQGDISPNSASVNNLLSLAFNFDSFLFSDYMIYQSDLNTVTLVWCDKLNYSEGLVSSESSVHFISAVSDGSGNFTYSEGDSDNFFLYVSNTVVSNVQSLGFKSTLYSQSYNYSLLRYFGIFAMACLLVITVINLRKVNSH